MNIIFSIGTYVGIIIGVFGTIAYFSYTGSTLNFKKPAKK